jgi:hypothetical protein
MRAKDMEGRDAGAWGEKLSRSHPTAHLITKAENQKALRQTQKRVNQKAYKRTQNKKSPAREEH